MRLKLLIYSLLCRRYLLNFNIKIKSLAFDLGLWIFIFQIDVYGAYGFKIITTFQYWNAINDLFHYNVVMAPEHDVDIGTFHG